MVSKMEHVRTYHATHSATVMSSCQNEHVHECNFEHHRKLLLESQTGIDLRQYTAHDWWDTRFNLPS